jgi:hypothetical protein
MKDGNEGSFRVSGEKRTTTIDRRAARNAVAGRGYKAGRFTYVGNAAQPNTGTDTDTSPAPARLRSK